MSADGAAPASSRAPAVAEQKRGGRAWLAGQEGRFRPKVAPGHSHGQGEDGRGRFGPCPPSRPWRRGAGPGAAPGPGDPLGGVLRPAAAPPVARAGQGRVTDRVPIGWIDFMRRIRSSTASQQSFVGGDAGSPSGVWMADWTADDPRKGSTPSR